MPPQFAQQVGIFPPHDPLTERPDWRYVPEEERSSGSQVCPHCEEKIEGNLEIHIEECHPQVESD